MKAGESGNAESSHLHFELLMRVGDDLVEVSPLEHMQDVFANFVDKQGKPVIEDVRAAGQGALP